MRDLVEKYLSKSISRRGFLNNMKQVGVTVAAAKLVLSSLSDAEAQTSTTASVRASTTAPVKQFQGTGGACFAEQLMACGVKYIFGNSASEDAAFYDALVDRPQLNYILTPHEGPGAAMAAGYIKASQQPAIVMQAGSVGLMNAMGQLFNAYKEQTPLVIYSYRSDPSRSAGRWAWQPFWKANKSDGEHSRDWSGSLRRNTRLAGICSRPPTMRSRI